MIVAGEGSGDLYGSELAKAISQLRPDLKIKGVAGPKMRGAGVEALFNAEDISVVGIFEAVGKLRFLKRVFNGIKKELLSKKYASIVLIDLPDFNLRLAKAAKEIGIPVIYYISPQIWAWRRWRIKKVKRYVDKMLVILPFEVEFYKKSGVDVEFVGHPLIDLVKTPYSKEEICHRFDLEMDEPIICLVPGSREIEIKHNFPIIIQSAEIIKKALPESQFILPLATTLDRQQVEKFISKKDLEIKITEDLTDETKNTADFIIVVSGTATLETALLEKPMVIFYRGTLFEWLLVETFLTIPYFGLVNIIAGKEIVPELRQYQASPKKIAEITIKALKESNYYNSMKEELLKIRQVLGEPGASMRCAQKISDFLENRTTASV